VDEPGFPNCGMTGLCFRTMEGRESSLKGQGRELGRREEVEVTSMQKRNRGSTNHNVPKKKKNENAPGARKGRGGGVESAKGQERLAHGEKWSGKNRRSTTVYGWSERR